MMTPQPPEKAQHDRANISFEFMQRKCVRPVYRYALASGSVLIPKESDNSITDFLNTHPDFIPLIKTAAHNGATYVQNLVPLSPSTSFDQIQTDIYFDQEKTEFCLYIQISGMTLHDLDMAALLATSSAIMYAWSELKNISPLINIGPLQILAKTNDTGALWVAPYAKNDPMVAKISLPTQSLLGTRAAVLVMSDRASSGIYTDESGHIITKRLKDMGAAILAHHVIPDEHDMIVQNVTDLCAKWDIDFLVLSGGTGPGPRDRTPDVLQTLFDRSLDGFGDFLRHESSHFTDTAWLSRMTAGMIGKTFVIALPGSPKAVTECFDIFSPFLGDALIKIKRQGFEK